MQLIYYPDPILSKKCQPAINPSKKQNIKNSKRRLAPRSWSEALASEMWKIMDDNNGIGLAAPQVGLNIRMFVWKHNGRNQTIWNPELSDISGGCITSAEGCLSLPKVTIKLQRPTSSVLNGIGLNGQPLRAFGNSVTTRIWQHEIDHLDGKLIIDNMSREDIIANYDAITILDPELQNINVSLLNHFIRHTLDRIDRLLNREL